MNKLKITDVRALPGDAAFLIDDGHTALLYDTGFGFTGNQIAAKIKDALNGRSLDCILLTHSHYDHALGSATIAKHFPGVKVVAAEYTRQIFEKPTARAAMLELDRKAALRYGVADYETPDDSLRVDIAVTDGQMLTCGTIALTVVALPGHTKCSIGFYLSEQKLLLGTETLGVCFGKGTYLPSFLVGYEMTLSSFQKAKALDIEGILLPHYGLVGTAEAKAYLQKSEEVTVYTANKVQELLKAGHSEQEILDYFTERFYLPHVAPVYPRDAFLLNTSIMIRLVSKERS